MLTPDSLAALGKNMAEKGLVLAMYLNIPTTRLVNLRLAGSEKNLSEDDMAIEMLTLWKTLRATAKDKDKVADLERALKEMGKTEHAEVLMEKYQADMELTADCFT